jgi:hypothetical protein
MADFTKRRCPGVATQGQALGLGHTWPPRVGKARGGQWFLWAKAPYTNQLATHHMFYPYFLLGWHEGLVWPLLGFNPGVQLGQLVAIAA